MPRQLVHMFLATVAIGAPICHAVPSLQPEKEQPVKEAPAKAPEPPEIRLIDPGAADHRAEIRYHPGVGFTQVVAMRIKFDIGTTVNGQKGPSSPIPGTEYTMKVVVDQVDPDHAIHYRKTTVGTDVFDTEGAQPMMVASVKEQLKGLKSMEGVIVMSDRGIIRSASFTGLDASNPMMKQTMDSMEQSIAQFSQPFPAEPVGVGAKWEVKSHMTMNGIAVETVGTYAITERTGDVLKVSIQQEINAKEQDMKVPTLPNMKAHVKSMTGSGKGTMTVDLTRVMPEPSEITSSSTTDMSMSFQGQNMAMQQATKIAMTLAPGKVPAAEPAKPGSDTKKVEKAPEQDKK